MTLRPAPPPSPSPTRGEGSAVIGDVSPDPAMVVPAARWPNQRRTVPFNALPEPTVIARPLRQVPPLPPVGRGWGRGVGRRSRLTLRPAPPPSPSPTRGEGSAVNGEVTADPTMVVPTARWPNQRRALCASALP
ncbi:MAG: hypothetical protein B7Z10_07130 [Rhodobacterales bacterium 32-66-7]|nr:MAG: hypothetical protein B7Z10_07130 [Rhodobacterales bacterium 32-66-7]